MIQFIVPGTPVPKGRPRSFIRGGKIGHYTPQKTVDYETSVRMMAMAAMQGRRPLIGGVEAEIKATLAIPQAGRKNAVTGLWAILTHHIPMRIILQKQYVMRAMGLFGWMIGRYSG